MNSKERKEAVRKLLHELADQQNDDYDHDEMHAAAEVVGLTDLSGTNEYVTRWVDRLLQRSHDRQVSQ